jgi:hypothetical protein
VDTHIYEPKLTIVEMRIENEINSISGKSHDELVNESKRAK